MFVYPALVPAAARAQLDAVVGKADAAFRRWESDGVVWNGRRLVCAPGPGGSDTVAINTLLNVIDAVVETLCAVAQHEHWSAADLRVAVDDLVQQRVDWTYTHQYSRTRVRVAWKRRIEELFHAQTSWRYFKATLRTLAGTTTVAAIERSAPVRPTLGQQLKALRIEAHWTQEQLSAEVNIDLQAVKLHLADKRQLRFSTAQRYEQVFSKKLKRDVRLTY
jgi:DNA-binding XRE family transcriptional regulator